jgi:septal ring factor EnvC (AmiA/AmiB activator)
VTAPVPPRPPEPPLDALPPDAPATVEDVRTTRRWTWVAFAWAIAASAIAVLALVTASNNKNDNPRPAQTSPETTAQIQQLAKQTNERLDAFSRRLNGTARAADLQKLEKRLATAESDATNAKDDAAKQATTLDTLKTDVADLKRRVDTLEKSQQQNQPGTTTTP